MGGRNIQNLSNENIATYNPSPVETSSFLKPYTFLTVTIMSFVIFVTIFGSVVVFTALHRLKRLRTLTNYIILTLCISNFLMGLTVLPLATIADVNEIWILGTIICDIWLILDILFYTITMFCLILITVDRLIAVNYPLQYGLHMTRGKIAFLLASIWLLIALLVELPFSLKWNSDTVRLQNIQDSGIECQLNLTMAYATTSSIIAFFMPSIVCSCMYFKMYRSAKMQARRVHDLHAMSNNIMNESIQRMRVYGIEERAVKKLGILLLCFMICWTPYHVSECTRATCNNTCVSYIARRFIFWLAHCNACANSVIFITLNKEFKDMFLNIFQKICCFRGSNTRSSGNDVSRIEVLQSENTTHTT